MEGRLEHSLQLQKSAETIIATLPPIVGEWYTRKAISTEPTTRLKYIQDIRRFLRWYQGRKGIAGNLRDLDLSQITETDIASYLLSIQVIAGSEGKQKRSSASYQRQLYSCLYNFCDFLASAKVTNGNAMAHLDPPRHSDDVQRVILEPEQANAALRKTQTGVGSDLAKERQEEWWERDCAILMVAMTTGLRVTAIAELNVGDVDLEGKTLKAIDKRLKAQIKALNEDTVDILRAWISKREILLARKGKQSDALFISNRLTRMTRNSIANITKKYAGVSPHKLRAFAFTEVYKITRDVRATQEFSGHASIDTLNRCYIRTDHMEGKRRGAEIMGGVVHLVDHEGKGKENGDENL